MRHKLAVPTLLIPSGHDGVSILDTPAAITPWTVYHHRYAVALTRCGAARFRYRGCEYIHGPGAVFFFEPDEVHRDVRIASAASYRIVFLEPEILNRYLPGRVKRFPCVPVVDPSLAAAIDKLALAFGTPLHGLATETAMMNMMGLLAPYCDAAPPAPVRPARLERARSHLLHHFARNVPLTELARHVGLSADHLLESFRDAFGLPPHAFQIAVRLARARDLLIDGHAASQVAAAVGFVDQAHLIRHFKRAHGVTPGALVGALVVPNET